MIKDALFVFFFVVMLFCVLAALVSFYCVIWGEGELAVKLFATYCATAVVSGAITNVLKD